ncbi:chymotrypsin-1-like [Bradysia coprophila]|uniref:chymotrypsin-1-like n=1 Tax=Bradysia coprophila TaxID=38358 RepID=UPI00187DD793|nr:chymotrypsin-1-like [Bradysia coprophila]
MRLLLFAISCVLQSIYGSYILKERVLPPNISLRIVGGDDAPERLAPFQCSIQLNGKHFCGCAIINANFVLTASHCVVGKSPEIATILVGTNNLSSGGTYYGVERLIPHEHFDTPDAANDVALVKIRGSIQFNKHVKPIELDEEEVPDGAVVQLTGWGRMEVGGGTPNQLQYANLTILGWDKCNKTNLAKLELLHEGHICTVGVRGTGVCGGDSGGPLSYRGKLVGIVNIGIPCALGNPDAYASISYYIDWITEHQKNVTTTAPLYANLIEKDQSENYASDVKIGKWN